MGRPASVTVFCPGGRWTQVEWYVGTIFLTKRYDAGAGNFVRWRWFSAGFPPYWQGDFRGSALITLWPSVYVSLEFMPDNDVNVVVTAA